jgi:hypothetical protein
MTNERTIPWHYRRWVILFVNLLIAFGVLWFLMAQTRLTNEQLAQVRVGMTTAEARRLLGRPLTLNDYAGILIRPALSQGGIDDHLVLHPVSAWNSTLTATAKGPIEFTVIRNESEDWKLWHRHLLWVGREKLLWIKEDAQGVIQHVWLLPVRAEGGGLQGWAENLYLRWFPPPNPPGTITVTLPE